MAKHSDQRAGDYEAENTGGLLSGLLADEEHLDRRAMFRLGSWGAASVGAVVVAVLANQSGMKSRHDEIAALDLTRQSQQIQSVAKESQNETRRLASAIDTLNGDRDRLYSRLTNLEQGLESVTGAIAKQSVAPPPAPPPVMPAAAAATSQPVAQSAAPEPAPAVAPVATTTVTAAPTMEKTATEKPRADVKKPAASAAAPVAVAAPPSPAAATVAAAPPAPAPSNPPPTTSAEPLMASKSSIPPPDAGAGKPIEPEPSAKTADKTADKTAAVTPPPAAPAPAPMTTPAGTAPAPEVVASAPTAGMVAAAEPAASASSPVPVKRTEFGVDVGSANSVSGLRALWRGLLKWRSNAALATLQPIIVVKEGNNGLGMQLRLVAGPLTDAAAAAKICAAMTANDRHCETTVYDGQRLAMAADEAPATTESTSAKPSSEKPSSEKPASEKPSSGTSDPASAKPGSTRQSSHRRSYSYAKRTPPEEPPKPPPPQPSSLSWFHLRSQ